MSTKKRKTARSSEQLKAHLGKDRYDDFWLTDAVRPALHVPVVPREGYRIQSYRDPEGSFEVPALVAAISRESLFDAFLSLLAPLGEVVDIVLESSHSSDGPQNADLRREQIDSPVLQSILCDFEDLLMHDGCTGIAVIGAGDSPIEVQFDEHKLLVIYASDLEPFERILMQAGVYRDDTMKLLSEAEHLHSTTAERADEFDQFCFRLGVGEPAESMSW